MSHCKLYLLTCINIYNNTSHLSSSFPSTVLPFNLALYKILLQYLSSTISVQPTGSLIIICCFTLSHFLFKHCFPTVPSLAIYWYVNSILLTYALRTFPSPLYLLKRLYLQVLVLNQTFSAFQVVRKPSSKFGLHVGNMKFNTKITYKQAYVELHV